MARKSFAMLLAALTASTVLAVADGELRTWTDATGKFKVEAQFVSQEKDKVTLKDKDGKLFEIETKKLSAGDQKHLADLAKMPPMPEDPFKPVGSGKTVSPDWSNSREIEVTAPVEWKDVSLGKLDEVKFKSALVPLSPRLDFFEGCSALVVNPASRRALVGYQWGGKSARIVYCDLEAGKALSQTTIPTATATVTPIALSDDGTQAAFKRTTDGKDTLELWSMSEKGNEKIADFSAANASVKSKGRSKGHDIRWAVFLDKKRLLTASYGGGLVVMWELPSLKPLYHVITAGESVPALSADRKHLAFVTGKELAVLDVDAGKVIATRPTPQHLPWASLAISPGGKWIACGSHNHLYVWNAATGDLHRDHLVNPLDVWGYVNWANDDMLFVGNKALMDVDLGYRFWDFKDHNHVHVHGNHAWFVTHQLGSNAGAILPTALPTPAVQVAFDKAKAEIVLKPGTTVKIDVRSLPDPEDRVKTAKALEDQLVKKGCKVGEDGTIELVATASTGKIVEMNFVPGTNNNRPWMPTPPRLPGSAPPPLPPGTKVRTVKMEEHFSHLKFVAQGRTVWETKGDNLPKRVQLEEGETLEQHLKKLERPNYGFYQTVDLPRVLHRTAGFAPLGTSAVGLTGVK